MKKLPLQELVRQRLQTLVADKRVPHDILGKFLGLSRSGVTRLLNDEGSGIGLQHIERLCEFFQMTPCELMNSPSSVIQEVKPLEAQLLHQFRNMTELQRHGLLTVLESRSDENGKRTMRRARLGRAELTDEQQLVVDLYARSEPQAREGVLKVLRGTAKAHDAQVERDGDMSE